MLVLNADTTRRPRIAETWFRLFTGGQNVSPTTGFIPRLRAEGRSPGCGFFWILMPQRQAGDFMVASGNCPAARSIRAEPWMCRSHYLYRTTGTARHLPYDSPMAGISLQIALAIPGALAAVGAVTTYIPLSGRRRHMRRAEQLSKIVDVEDQTCPATLKAALSYERNWVSAYYMVRPSRRDKIDLGVAVVSTVSTSAVIVPVGVAILPSGPLVAWLYIIALSLGVSFMAARAIDLARWIRARRFLHATLCAHNDLPEIPRPRVFSVKSRAPSRPEIRQWIVTAFDCVEPQPDSLNSVRIELLRNTITEWEISLRPPWHGAFRRG